MKRIPVWFILVAMLLLPREPRAFAQTGANGRTTIKYISSEAVYIAAGRNQGISTGDTIGVVQNLRIVALLVVANLGGNSAACRLLQDKTKIQVGDIVIFKTATNGAGVTAAPAAKTIPPPGARASRQASRTTSKKNLPNHLRGYVSIQNQYQQDMTGSNLSSQQPSVSAKIALENIAGTGLMLRVQHRSRLYHRSATFASNTPNNEWTHRLFEVALMFKNDNSPIELGIGRVLSPQIRGIGYIDGGHISTKIYNSFRLGLAAGTEPDDRDSRYNPDRKKYGAFLSYEAGSYSGQHLASTLALSGSYEKSMISREFVYLQNSYWLARRFSIYQSVEIDINRRWRKDLAGRSLSFSNLYVSATLNLARFAALDVSYDARKNIRTYSTYNTPDSLFDATVHQGISGGFSLQLPLQMSLRGNVGVRLLERVGQDNRFASIDYGIRHFPLRGHSLTMRLSVFDTEFTRGYRPVMTYRFPVMRAFSLNLSGGGYIYKSAFATTSSYFGEISSYMNLTRHFYASCNYRQYFDRGVQSIQAFAELGMNF